MPFSMKTYNRVRKVPANKPPKRRGCAPTSLLRPSLPTQHDWVRTGRRAAGLKDTVTGPWTAARSAGSCGSNGDLLSEPEATLARRSEVGATPLSDMSGTRPGTRQRTRDAWGANRPEIRGTERGVRPSTALSARRTCHPQYSQSQKTPVPPEETSAVAHRIRG